MTTATLPRHRNRFGVSVPRLWPSETFVCVASGPSLTEEDVLLCASREVRIVAVKDAIRLVPAGSVDALYACDAKWWRHHKPTYEGLRYSIEPGAAEYATVLRNTGDRGLETDPSGLRTGRNSGYQAVNLAVHLGAARVILLGYDMGDQAGKDHWFGRHPYPAMRPPYQIFREFFPSIVEPLKALGVEVINASRRTALDCFPRVRLEEALP
jgi:hypothetical protein